MRGRAVVTFGLAMAVLGLVLACPLTAAAVSYSLSLSPASVPGAAPGSEIFYDLTVTNTSGALLNLGTLFTGRQLDFGLVAAASVAGAPTLFSTIADFNQEFTPFAQLNNLAIAASTTFRFGELGLQTNFFGVLPGALTPSGTHIDLTAKGPDPNCLSCEILATASVDVPVGVAVPEPATILLVSAAVAGLAVARRAGRALSSRRRPQAQA